MEEKKGNIILFSVLVILMIIAIVIVIMNPNKIKKTPEINEKIEENQIENKNEIDINKINEQEETKVSMQEGGKFCKMGSKILFYEDKNKTIYLQDLNQSRTDKLVTLPYELNKMYFDGNDIYCIPSYYSGKGIYKVDLQGNMKKINDNVSLQLLITENNIFFVKQIGYDEFNQNPQGVICVIDKDGNNITEIAQNVKNYFFLQNDKIYYTTQDRKMYVINKDGTNQKDITQGRKFAIHVSDKFLLYIDYSDQEAEHILNFDTNEDSVIGHFGKLKNYQGRIFLNARKRLDDGSIDDDYTLFEIVEDGKVKEIGKVANFGTDLRYIVSEKAYMFSQQEGIYLVNLDNNQKENIESYKNCRYFLGGYGYKIDDTNLEDIKIERIQL